MTAEKQFILPKYRKIIAILVALVLLSTAALIGWIVHLQYFHKGSTTVVIPNNRIEESTSLPAARIQKTALTGPMRAISLTETESRPPQADSSISLYKGLPSDNARFHAQNMLPGDRETKYFAVKVHHGEAVEVFFSAEVTQQTKNLANILHIRITAMESGAILYDGSLKDMDPEGYSQVFAPSQAQETIAYYKIEVSLPTSAGNEYQAAMLEAKFNWFVKDTGPLVPPPTVGDPGIVIIGLVMVASAVAICVIVLFGKRRERKAG